MAIYTKDGTLNLIFPKGDLYSSISKADFENWNTYYTQMEEIDISIVAEWLCNVKALSVDTTYTDKDGNSLPYYPIFNTGHKYQVDPASPDPENPLYLTADEFPGISVYFGGNQFVHNRYPNSSGTTWLFDGYPDDGNPRYLPYLLSEACWFEVYLGKFYAKKHRLNENVGPNQSYYTEHSITKTGAKIVRCTADWNGGISTLTYDIQITDTYY